MGARRVPPYDKDTPPIEIIFLLTSQTIHRLFSVYLNFVSVVYLFLQSF